MPDSTACLDAGDAHHTFTPENSSQPTMKKQADRSNTNADKITDSGRRSSKNGEIEAYLARHYAFRYNTCLVLTGEQGRFKTTFLDLLCPPKLHDYSYTGKIYPQEKDTLTYVGQNLIINIDDQLKALNKRDENELKNLITCPMVKYRMPYDKHVEEHPHMASFVALVNGNDFLTDPTGSRRFLPFEALSIDINRAKAVSMDAVYAEAKSLLQSGFRYWFNDEEIAELYRESETFQVQTAEMELLLRCFELPTTDSDCSYLTTTEILTYLGTYTRQPLTAKRMGEALKKAGYIKVSRRRNGGTAAARCMSTKSERSSPVPSFKSVVATCSQSRSNFDLYGYYWKTIDYGDCSL